jgi:hypothetical protein
VKKYSLTIGFLLTALVLALAAQPQAAEKEKAETDPIQVILEDYFRAGQLLAADSLAGVKQQVKSIFTASDSLLKSEDISTEENEDYLARLKSIQAAAKQFDSKDVNTARESYKALSQAVTGLVKDYGFSGQAYSFYCPMVKETWLQSEDQIANPFYGSKMLRCGKMTGMVKEGKYVEKSDEKKEVHSH